MKNLVYPCVVAACFFLFYPTTAFSAQAGKPAPPVTLSDLMGRIVALEQFHGKVIFLDFWASWCASCREELPALDKLYKKYNAGGFEVIGIAVDSSEIQVTKLLQKSPVAFTMLIDNKGDVAEAYCFSGLPAGFLIGRDGIIRYVHAGFSEEFLLMVEKEIIDLIKQN